MSEEAAVYTAGTDDPAHWSDPVPAPSEAAGLPPLDTRGLDVGDLRGVLQGFYEDAVARGHRATAERLRRAVDRARRLGAAKRRLRFLVMDPNLAAIDYPGTLGGAAAVAATRAFARAAGARWAALDLDGQQAVLDEFYAAIGPALGEEPATAKEDDDARP